MDRKVGNSFWSAQEGGEKTTSKQKDFKPLGNIIFLALMLKIQLLIKKKLPSKVKYVFPNPLPLSKAFGASTLLRPWFQCSVFKNVAMYAVDFGDLKMILGGIGCGDGVGV